MPDDEAKLDAAKDKSVTELLDAVKRKHDKILRNRQAVAFCSAMIPEQEKELARSIKYMQEYADAVQRVSKLLETNRIRLAHAIEFCNANDEDHEKVKVAEALARKIEKLQKQIAEHKIKIESQMKDS